MASIAVVGEERNILGFKPFGVDIYVYDQKNGHSNEWFGAIVEKGYALLLITEVIAEKFKDQVELLWERDVPVVLTIKGLGEAKGIAMEHLRSLVIKAIGTDLFKES